MAELVAVVVELLAVTETLLGMEIQQELIMHSMVVWAEINLEVTLVQVQAVAAVVDHTITQTIKAEMADQE
jgi:hypothetical protein